MMLCVEIALSIPDNEAVTALQTLQRLGVPVAGLERADLYRFEVADDRAEALIATLRGLETVFNPNKHVLRVRALDRPETGEVWVDEIGKESEPSGAAVRIAGRPLPGVRGFERFKAWRLTVREGVPLAETVTAATETLLYNPAFQKVRRA